MNTSLTDKLNLFFYSLATIVMIAIVALLILRVVAGYANLNFFGWTYVTLRRLADPMIGPVRHALIGFRVDPKFAPLMTVLITLLLWWVLTQAAGSTLDTIANVTEAVRRQKVASVIGHLLIGLLKLYSLMIFLRIVFSWVMVSYSNRVMRFLYKTTEPLLGPLRRMIPPVGMFDISALLAFVVLWVLQFMVQGAFLS